MRYLNTADFRSADPVPAEGRCRQYQKVKFPENLKIVEDFGNKKKKTKIKENQNDLDVRYLYIIIHPFL